MEQQVASQVREGNGLGKEKGENDGKWWQFA